MNKLLTKIAASVLGLSMAVGVGVAAANNNGNGVATLASPGDTAKYEFHLGSGNTWGTSTSNSLTKNTVTWKTTTLTNAGNWNNGYSGQQFGTSSANGKIIAETADSWGEQSSATAYYGKTEISTIVLWLNNGSGTITTYDVKVDGVSCSKSGSISKNTTANGDYSKTSPVTFTPDPGHKSGVVKIEVGTSSKAFYFAGIDINCAEPQPDTAELTGLRIAEGTPNKLYEPGASFDGTGLTVYASWDDEEDTSKNVVSDVVWNGGNALTAGLNQTITGYHSHDENEEYPIQVTGVDVANADFTHTYSSNSMFEGTSYSTTETKTHTPTSGPEYITLGGYNYTSGTTMSLRNTSGMYVGNNTEYSKYIRRIVITVNSNSQYDKVKMFEGPVALSEATEVPQNASDDKLTLTYDFSDTNQYFKFKTTSAYYINMTSVKVFLGSTPVAKVVDEVTISTPGSVYVGKELQLSATVSYTNAESDNKVTWSVTDGDGATIDASTGLLTAVDATETEITATSVEKDGNGNAVTASVTITPLANPIVSVAWDTSSAKKVYNVNESLNISGVTATGTNAAGDDDVELTLTASNFSGFDSSTPIGSQTITVSYPNSVNPSNPFTTTYTIKVVATPDLEITKDNFASGSYNVNDGEHVYGGITFDVKDTYQNSNAIQVKASTGQFHNTDPLGQGITGLSIKVKTNSALIYFGESVLTSNTGDQAETVDSGDEVSVELDSNSYQYIRIIGANSKYCVIEYIKVWYTPFVPAVTLDETSFEFTQGDTGYCDVEATASHFTDNSGVVFTATSSNQDVLDDDDILVIDNAITIDKESVNPGTTTVTVTGTYSSASEVASATFTITCDAAQRNLLSISITTVSSDTEFEAGAKFTISDLVITGTFDAAPLTADVTSECTFKLWNGATETTVTPGTSTLSAGSYTVRISHAGSAAAETLTYSITVLSSSSLAITQSDIGESFAYADTNETSLDVALNAQLNSTVDLESYGLYKNGTNIQMNSGKGTYIKNTIAVPGRILRIEMDWEAGTDKNTPTIYFGNSYYSTKPTIGGTQATAGSNNSVSANGNFSYFYFDGTTVTGSCQMSEMRIIYIENDEGAARNFADKYLLMNTYDQGGSHGSTAGNNTCLTQYDVASTAYGKLTTEQKAEFAKLSAAVTRMQDWASANGYTFNASAGTFTQNSKAVVFNVIGKDTNVAIIITLVSLISISAFGAFLFLRKRKEQ